MFKRLINHFFLNRFVLIILLSMVITVLLGLVKVAIVNWQLINLPKCHNCNIVINKIHVKDCNRKVIESEKGKTLWQPGNKFSLLKVIQILLI